jgi:hypothetical protein
VSPDTHAFGAAEGNNLFRVFERAGVLPATNVGGGGKLQQVGIWAKPLTDVDVEINAHASV